MEVILLLAVLACPIVMGSTMIWMMRSMKHGAGRSEPNQGSGEV